MINLEKSVKVEDNYGRHVGMAYRTGRFVHQSGSALEGKYTKNKTRISNFKHKFTNAD